MAWLASHFNKTEGAAHASRVASPLVGSGERLFVGGLFMTRYLNCVNIVLWVVLASRAANLVSSVENLWYITFLLVKLRICAKLGKLPASLATQNVKFRLLIQH